MNFPSVEFDSVCSVELRSLLRCFVFEAVCCFNVSSLFESEEALEWREMLIISHYLLSDVLMSPLELHREAENPTL